MGVPNVMAMTLPEWVVIMRAWNKANGAAGDDLRPPTDAEFEAAIYGTLH